MNYVIGDIVKNKKMYTLQKNKLKILIFRMKCKMNHLFQPLLIKFLPSLKTFTVAKLMRMTFKTKSLSILWRPKLVLMRSWKTILILMMNPQNLRTSMKVSILTQKFKKNSNRILLMSKKHIWINKWKIIKRELF